jgi:hypothetical protein
VGGEVGSSQSWNRYVYVLNNPVKLIDPFGTAHLDPNSTEDQIRWIGDRSDEVVVTAEDPEMTVSERRSTALRVAGGGATTEEVPWDAAVQNASITAGGSVPLGAVKKVGKTAVPIPARLTGSVSLTMEGINVNLAVSPGASTPSGYIIATETMTFGKATGDPSGSIDYQGGAGLFGGGEVATDLRSYVSVTGKFGLGFGHSGGLGKDLSFPILDDLTVVSFK